MSEQSSASNENGNEKGNGRALVRVSMNLRPEAAKAAEEIAEKRNITKTDVVQRGIALEKVLEDINERKGALIVELPDGTRERILIPW